MSDILIKGMEMPKNEPLLIKINPDGSVSTTAKNGYRKYAAVPAADVEPVQEWISVKDRLPEVGGYVVCIAKRNPFSRFMPMVARIEKNGWVNPITEQYISDVTHWMTMPQPPKGE